MPPWVCFKLSLSCNCLFDFFCWNFVFFRNSMQNYRREPLVEKIQDSVVHVPKSNASANQLPKFVDETQRYQNPKQHREENTVISRRIWRLWPLVIGLDADGQEPVVKIRMGVPPARQNGREQVFFIQASQGAGIGPALAFVSLSDAVGPGFQSAAQPLRQSKENKTCKAQERHSVHPFAKQVAERFEECPRQKGQGPQE